MNFTLEKIIASIGLDGLYIFNVVCTCGSFSKASEKLPLSPSAIGKRVSDIEALVGHKLLEKNHIGVHATSMGQKLFTAWYAIEKTLKGFQVKHGKYSQYQAVARNIIEVSSSFDKIINLDYLDAMCIGDLSIFTARPPLEMTVRDGITPLKHVDSESIQGSITESDIHAVIASPSGARDVHGMKPFLLRINNVLLYTKGCGDAKALADYPLNGQRVWAASGAVVNARSMTNAGLNLKIRDSGMSTSTLIAWASKSLKNGDFILIPRSGKQQIDLLKGFSLITTLHEFTSREFICNLRRTSDTEAFVAWMMEIFGADAHLATPNAKSASS